MMTTFYIYEVPGIKNGCTVQWQKRSQQNFERYNIMPALVETYKYPDEPEYWQIVGDREWELAEKNGYTKGPHYRIARERRILANRIGCASGGRIGGKIGGKIGGAKNVDSGQWQSIKSAGGKIGGKIVQAILRTCPYCNITIKGMTYHRWHGDNCKNKPK